MVDQVKSRVNNRREGRVSHSVYALYASLAKVHDLLLVFVLALKPQVHACLTLTHAVRVTRIPRTVLHA